MRYVATRDSFGFMGRYWSRGDVTDDIGEKEKVPPHFSPVKGASPAAVAAVLARTEKKKVVSIFDRSRKNNSPITPVNPVPEGTKPPVDETGKDKGSAQEK